MKKTAIILLSVLAGIVILMGVLNLAFGTGGYPYGFGGHMIPGGMMGVGFIGMLLFWGFIIFLILSLAQNGSPFSRDQSYSMSSKEILDKKYVRGEITEEEYVRKKQTLNESRNHNA